MHKSLMLTAGVIQYCWQSDKFEIVETSKNGIQTMALALAWAVFHNFFSVSSLKIKCCSFVFVLSVVLWSCRARAKDFIHRHSTYCRIPKSHYKIVCFLPFCFLYIIFFFRRFSHFILFGIKSFKKKRK